MSYICPVEQEGTRKTKSKHSMNSIRDLRMSLGRFVWLNCRVWIEPNMAQLRCLRGLTGDELNDGSRAGPVDWEDSLAKASLSNNSYVKGKVSTAKQTYLGSTPRETLLTLFTLH